MLNTAVFILFWLLVAGLLCLLHRLHKQKFVDFITLRALQGKTADPKDIWMCRSCTEVFHDEDEYIYTFPPARCPRCGQNEPDSFIPATRYIKTHD